MTPYRRVIVEAAQMGIPPIWIAHELGKSPGAIKSILSQERGRGEVIPNFRSGRRDFGIPKPLTRYQRWVLLTGGEI